jgi:F-type H+-transporting ATPase subunit gamma
MTERFADIAARIDGVRQLGAVVNAMRGIAAARVQQARAQVVAVDRYAATIAAAIAQAVTLAAPVITPIIPHPNRTGLVLFCAEQGFAGAFNERVLDSARSDVASAELFLIGTRGNAAAAERGVVPHWKSAMASHSASIPKLADRIADALYGRIAAGAIGRLDVVFAKGPSGGSTQVQRLRLFPLDMAQPPAASDAALVNLPPPVLLNELTAEYVHAQLCHAALHAFAAENAARMAAMEAARHQIERQLAALIATQRHVRQEEITAEIIELAAGERASQSVRKRIVYN